MRDLNSLFLFNLQTLYLSNILKTLKALTTLDDASKNMTINCTAGLILHTIEQCEQDDNPEHVSKKKKKKREENNL